MSDSRDEGPGARNCLSAGASLILPRNHRCSHSRTWPPRPLLKRQKHTRVGSHRAPPLEVSQTRWACLA